MYRVSLVIIIKLRWLRWRNVIYFLVLSKTHLTENIEEKKISLHGYDNICSLSTSPRTEGVILHFKRHWNGTRTIERNGDLKYWMLYWNSTYSKYDIFISEYCDIFELTI